MIPLILFYEQTNIMYDSVAHIALKINIGDPF